MTVARAGTRPASIIPDPLDAVLFDMDGLLLDTEAVHRRTMAEAAAAMGIDFPDALFLQLVGIHRDENRRTLAGHYGDAFPMDRFYDDADARFEAACREVIPLRPDVVLVLDLLDALEIPRGVVTSTASPFAAERLARVDLLDRFDALVTRSDVLRPKPAPDPYLLGCERLGARPAQTLALEDSHNGIRAAAAAGLVTIMVPDLLAPTAETDRLVAATLPGLADVATLIEAAVSRRRGAKPR